MNIRKMKLCMAACALCLASNAVRADIVVIVSAGNPLTTLSVAQVSDIFLGKVSTFPSGIRAIPLDQDEGAQVRDAFYLKTTGKSPAQIYSYWSKIIFTGKAQAPKEVGDDGAVRKLVAKNTNMVGYIDKGMADSSVKIVFSIP
jgi:ABC-type phosphate transport system substrate-binding protein